MRTEPEAAADADDPAKARCDRRYAYEDFEIGGYDAHPHIKAEVSV